MLWGYIEHMWERGHIKIHPCWPNDAWTEFGELNLVYWIGCEELNLITASLWMILKLLWKCNSSALQTSLSLNSYIFQPIIFLFLEQKQQRITGTILDERQWQHEGYKYQTKMVTWHNPTSEEQDTWLGQPIINKAPDQSEHDTHTRQE